MRRSVERQKIIRNTVSGFKNYLLSVEHTTVHKSNSDCITLMVKFVEIETEASKVRVTDYLAMLLAASKEME
jgi:hypothetical protein